MGIRLKSSAWGASSKKWLCGIVFSMFAGKAMCILESDNLFEIVNSDIDWSIISYARNEATNRLDGDLKLSPGVLYDVGWRITGKSPNEIEQAKKAHEIEPKDSYLGHGRLVDEKPSESARTREAFFQEQVNAPLLHCLKDLPDELSKSAKRDLEKLIITTMSDVALSYAHVPLGVATQVEHVAPEPPLSHSILDFYDSLASSILSKIESALKILRDQGNLTEKSFTSNVRSLEIVFRLSDIFLRYLAALEKHNLISTTLLKEIINQKTEGQLIFNYILGFLIDTSTATAQYLLYDLKSSATNSGFTEEIHQVLKHLEVGTWEKIEHLHIIALTKGYSLHNKIIEPLGEMLTKMTSPQYKPLFHNAAFEQTIQHLYESICKTIFAYPLQMDADWVTNYQLRDLMILHNMLSFLVRYHVSPETNLKIATSARYSQIQAFDEEMRLFSDSLKLVYNEYGNLLKWIAGRNPSVSWTEISKSKFHVYLTDSVHKNEGIFAQHERNSVAEFGDRENKGLKSNSLFAHGENFGTNDELATSPIIHTLRELSSKMIRESKELIDDERSLRLRVDDNQGIFKLAIKGELTSIESLLSNPGGATRE